MSKSNRERSIEEMLYPSLRRKRMAAENKPAEPPPEVPARIVKCHIHDLPMTVSGPVYECAECDKPTSEVPAPDEAIWVAEWLGSGDRVGSYYDTEPSKETKTYLYERGIDVVRYVRSRS
jgi:hypothetical protein